MRIIFFLVLLLGLGIAGFAGNMVMSRFDAYADRVRQLEIEVGEKVELVDVAIATKDLRYGRPLEKEDIQIIKWPKSAQPENSFTSLEELFGKENEGLEARTILREIDKGEIISVRKVTGFGQDAGVVSRLQKGARAFTLKVDVSSGVSGFLRPGDLVDVFWTGRIGEGTGTRLILSSVELIAIDQTSERGDTPAIARTVTVAVSPERVGILAQAQATGRLTLSLRGIGDAEAIDNIEINQNDLLGRDDAQVVKKQVCTIRVNKGAEVVEKTIPCPE